MRPVVIAGSTPRDLHTTALAFARGFSRPRLSDLSPRSMRTRTAFIILVAFVLSHAAGLLIYSHDRQEALQAAETLDVAERAASISVLLRNLPAAWRAEVAQATDSRNFRAWISDEAPFSTTGNKMAEVNLLGYLRSLLPRLADREVRVRIVRRVPDGIVRPGSASGLKTATGVEVPEAAVGPVVLISVHHPDGEWLNFAGLVSAPPSSLGSVLGANLLTATVVVVVAFWLVHGVTAPLSRLSVAAERLGKNIRTDPLPEEGPAEVVQAARAFNRMQTRLSRLVESRTDLLAAISHDLRTPITQMRLRTELMPAGTPRKKNLEALDEMEATILTFLDFARAGNDGEERLRIDLGALVESICADRSDVGADIECAVESQLLIECKRLAIKRALSNLIDNGLKYGRSVRVSAIRDGQSVRIRIDDEGPGIPAAELEMVFAPFYRGDRSRNRKTGGVGLGLGIAQAIVQDHGGGILLSNRPGGGLRAEIDLPV